MWRDTTVLLVCMSVGAVIGLVIRRRSPEACRRYAKWSVNPQRWKLYALGMVLFVLLSLQDFVSGNIVRGWCCLALAILEAAGIVIVLRRRGHPTKLDNSDGSTTVAV